MSKIKSKNAAGKPFLTDVKTLRAHARKHLKTGNVTTTYKGDVAKTIEILQSVLATEGRVVSRHIPSAQLRNALYYARAERSLSAGGGRQESGGDELLFRE